MKRVPLILLALAIVAGTLAVVASVPTPVNLPEVLAAQRRILDQRPDDAAAWNDLGNLLVLAADPAAAEEAYTRAVELAPDRSAYHYNLALLLQQRGERDKARREYEQVVELAPDNARAHFQLGAIAESRGNQRKAVASYARALRLEPSLGFADVNPAVIDSELMTQAMLRAYRERGVNPAAPRVYEEPGRIKDLLVPAAADGGEEETAAPRRVETGPGAERAAGSASVAPRRILTEDDLGEGNVNQAAPGGRAGYRPPAVRRTPPRPQVRTWTQPGAVPAAPDDGRQPGPAPRQRTIVPPPGGGIELVPTLPSTGKLEMYLWDGERGRTGSALELG